MNWPTIDELSRKPSVVLLLGPDRAAVSGVSTHLNLLLESDLARHFHLRHFQVGSEGRHEGGVGRLLRLAASPFALAATLVAERVDIVHLNTSLNRRAYWRDLAYMLVARLCGSRVVYQIHGGALPEQFAARRPLLAAVLRASLRLPQAIVVLASSEHAAYRKFTGGAPIRLVPNAIDCVPYLRLPRAAADGARRRPLRLLYIGRLARDKGLFEALQGLQKARWAGADAQLTIAGSGPDEAALRDAVNKLRLGGAVSFAGPVFGDDKVRLLGGADVLLFPTHAEGLPYALLECMAAGMPAITTRVGAIPDVVSDNLHGLFVAPKDAEGIGRAITRLADDPALVGKMGAACRERIRNHYSIQRLAAELGRLYTEIEPLRRAGKVAGV